MNYCGGFFVCFCLVTLSYSLWEFLFTNLLFFFVSISYRLIHRQRTSTRATASWRVWCWRFCERQIQISAPFWLLMALTWVLSCSTQPMRKQTHINTCKRSWLHRALLGTFSFFFSFLHLRTHHLFIPLQLLQKLKWSQGGDTTAWIPGKTNNRLKIVFGAGVHIFLFVRISDRNSLLCLFFFFHFFCAMFNLLIICTFPPWNSQVKNGWQVDGKSKAGVVSFASSNPFFKIKNKQTNKQTKNKANK